jgi:hypothetical protein
MIVQFVDVGTGETVYECGMNVPPRKGDSVTIEVGVIRSYNVTHVCWELGARGLAFVHVDIECTKL